MRRQVLTALGDVILVLISCMICCHSDPTLVARHQKALPFELRFIQDRSLKEWKAPELFQREFLYYLSGHDDDGRPIWIAEFGKWDLKKILESGDESVKIVDRYIDQLVGNVLDSLKLMSTPGEDDSPAEIVVIVDMDGYNLAQLASVASIRYLIRKVSELEPVARRRLGSAYVINTNFVAERFVNLIRPVLGDIMQRIEVYGTKKSIWMPKLLKNLPRDQLPQWYGGYSTFKPLQIYG